MPRTPQLQIAPYPTRLPAPIVFRSAHVPDDAVYPRHRHHWGELVHAFHGMMEIRLADRHFLAPPQYAVWLPPEVEHTGMNRRAAHHCSLYIAAELCGGMPRETCAIALPPLVRALLEHLRDHPPALPYGEREERLLRVLADQLADAPALPSYLPSSDDPVLAPVLQMLEEDPADPRGVAELAAAAGTTERTLMRRCRSELNMTLAEWRQRLRVVKAMPLLGEGRTVESVALDLGYGSASAFIAMFRRLTGTTPDEFRKAGQALR